MKALITVFSSIITIFLFIGCSTIYIIVPPEEVIINNPVQLPTPYPPAPPHPVGPPIIIAPIPDPQFVTDPPAVIIVQPKPTAPVRPEHRDIHAGHRPANQKPATPIVGQRESHSGRNPIVSNPPSQTYSERTGSRSDGRENTYRPARDAGVKINTR